MTMTSDERREVARKLREPKESLLAHPDEELIRLRYETGCQRGQDLYEHLADLVDRPTCSMNPIENAIGRVDFVYCSECKETFKAWEVEDFRYCPSCGAEVLDEDGAN